MRMKRYINTKRSEEEREQKGRKERKKGEKERIREDKRKMKRREKKRETVEGKRNEERRGNDCSREEEI